MKEGTQGVWMLGSPLHLEERGIHILFLDFEGFQSSAHVAPGAKSAKSSTRTNLANSTDSKLFALAALLSSTICFNIRQTFDEKTLDDLELIKGLEKRIKIRPPEQSASLMRERGTPGGRGTVDDQLYADHLFPQLMPRLVYLVRDSTLGSPILDKRENAITDNQYLESKLSELAKASKRKVTRTREDILKMFPDRELVSMHSPIDDMEQGNLDELAPEQLS